MLQAGERNLLWQKRKSHCAQRAHQQNSYSPPFLFFFFKNIVDLHGCVNFCCTAKWPSHSYMYLWGVYTYIHIHTHTHTFYICVCIHTHTIQCIQHICMCIQLHMYIYTHNVCIYTICVCIYSLSHAVRFAEGGMHKAKWVKQKRARNGWTDLRVASAAIMRRQSAYKGLVVGKRGGNNVRGRDVAKANVSPLPISGLDQHCNCPAKGRDWRKQAQQSILGQSGFTGDLPCVLVCVAQPKQSRPPSRWEPTLFLLVLSFIMFYRHWTEANPLVPQKQGPMVTSQHPSLLNLV